MTVSTTRPDQATPTVTGDLQALIQRLASIPARRHQVVSCYVRLEPRDRARAAYLIEFKDRLKTFHSHWVKGLSREARLRVERDLDRTMAYLSHPGDLPHTPGLAVFASEALGLFEAVPLPRVHRSRLMLDDTPWISELVAVEAETLPVLTAVVDRAHARFFQVTALQVTELDCLTGPSTRGGRFHSDRGGAPGWGEHGYHGRLEQERHQHYASVAQRLGEIIQHQPIRGIVLAGPTDHTAALTRFLPDPAARRLLGRAALNPTAIDPAELQSIVLATAHEHDQEALEAELKTLAEAVGSGWAVTGPRETLRALHRGQARTLYLREDLEGPGYRCARSGRLVLAKGECRGEGEPQPVEHLVDECLEEGLRQGVRIVMVPDSSASDVVDGLAATLRFR